MYVSLRNHSFGIRGVIFSHVPSCYKKVGDVLGSQNNANYKEVNIMHLYFDRDSLYSRIRDFVLKKPSLV